MYICILYVYLHISSVEVSGPKNIHPIIAFGSPPFVYCECVCTCEAILGFTDDACRSQFSFICALSKVPWGRLLPITPFSNQQHQCQQENRVVQSKTRRGPGKRRLANPLMENCVIALYIYVLRRTKGWVVVLRLNTTFDEKVLCCFLAIKEQSYCLTTLSIHLQSAEELFLFMHTHKCISLL